MTLIANLPWNDIPKADPGRLKRIRIDKIHPYDFYWTCDEDKNFILTLVINAELAPLLKKFKINIRGIDVKIAEDKEDNIVALAVILLDNQEADKFYKLCCDLIERSRQIENIKSAFEEVCKRLKQWQLFLSGRAKGLLSREEVQGLFSEIYFINEYLDFSPDNEDMIIHAWEGPVDGQHDFVLGDRAIEIKSISGYQRNKVRISSEDQLHTHLSHLFLRVYFLSDNISCTTGQSLNGLILTVKNKTQSSQVREAFEMKLMDAGYMDIDDYNAPCFALREIKTFQVTDEFPRITPDNVDTSIQNVAYDLLLSGIEKFKIDFQFEKD